MSLKHNSLPEVAASAVLDTILSEGMSEGDPLPTSAELADRFKVSGVVIREALAILSARGVLIRRQGREPTVAKPGPEVLVDVWRLRAHHDGIGTEEFLQCRAALEVQTASMAALARDAGALGEHIAAMRAATTREGFYEADVAFHMEVARLAGNRAIEIVLGSLQAIAWEAFTFGVDRISGDKGVDALANVIDLHETIRSAIARGQTRRAAKAMADHFRFSVPEIRLTV